MSRGPLTVLPSLFFVLISSLPVPLPLLAQDNYPLPPGDPETWKIPGQEERVAPEQLRAGPRERPMSQPSEQDRPQGPSGEVTQEFQGTPRLGDYAGTGMPEAGTKPRR